MDLQIKHKIISPVNVEERRNLDIRPGDTVRVWQKIQEKDKTRLQAFEGLILARKHGKEAGGTFTVRRVSSGVGMEKIFPLYSPMIDKIEILKRAKVRRSKLYYIREKAAKEIRRQMRRSRFMDISTESDIEAKANAEKAEQEKENIKEEATDVTQENTTESNDEVVDRKETEVKDEGEEVKENQTEEKPKDDKAKKEE